MPRERADGKKFGVEIECLIDSCYSASELASKMRANGLQCHAQSYNHTTCNEWKIVTDGSIRGSGTAVEVVSPPIKGKDGFEQIKKACESILELGGRVNQSTGLHVHINLLRKRFRDSKSSGVSIRELAVSEIANIMMLYARYESVIDLLLSPSRRNNQFCQSIRFRASNIQSRILNNQGEFLSAYPTIQSLTGDGSGRYYKVNLECYVRYNTVEFREHQGTLESEKIIRWIELLQAICKRAYEYSLEHELINPLNNNSNKPELIKEFLTNEIHEHLNRNTIQYFKRRFNKFAIEEGRTQW